MENQYKSLMDDMKEIRGNSLERWQVKYTEGKKV